MKFMRNGIKAMKRKPPHIPQPGERFGRLVVVRKGEDYVDPKSGKKKSRYWCQCDCESPEKLILGTALTSGAIKSCGCLHREISSETAKTKISHGKKYNDYDLTGDYGIGYTFNGEEFYFDLEDYEKIRNICWHMHIRGYITGHVVGSDKREIKMHQLILPTNDQYVVDYINTHAKNDNRKSNLRVATQMENTRNRRMLRNNTSGRTGVSYDKDSNRWVAYIGYNHKQIFLGRFDNFDDAVKAREKAEDKYFKEFKYRGEILNVHQT